MTDAAAHGPLAFVHIPKCSGTAFENYVLSIPGFGSSRAFTGVGPANEPETLADYFARTTSSPFRFGHIPFAAFSSSQAGTLFAVFLRDPVKRTLSHYRSWHDPRNFHPDDPHYLASDAALREALLFSQKATLEEFISSDNPIVRAGALGSMQTLYLSSCGGPMDEQLASAKRNLEKFAFVGITERFDDSIALFRTIFPDAPEYGLERAAENRSRAEAGDISPATIETIRAQAHHDVLLYEHAKALFQDRVDASSTARRTFLLSSLVARSAVAVKPGDDGAAEQSPETGNDPAARLAEAKRDRQQEAAAAEQALAMLQAENSALRQRLDHLVASHAQLAELYRDVVSSKTWRVAAALQSAFAWLRRK